MKPVHDKLPPNDAPLKLALLEDDLMFAAAARDWLQDLGYQVTHYPTGQACLTGMAEQDFDICIFDWQLPDLDGPSVMRTLQALKRMPPVIFLTAVDDSESVAQVLLAGADDYVIKPPTFTVLHARIQALIRRMAQKGELPTLETLGILTVDHLKKTISHNGQAIILTSMESDLAFYLLSHRGQLVTRTRLYRIMGVEQLAVDTRRLDVHISRLRSKLHLTIEHGWRLASVHLQGYRLEFLL
jgi:two-component system response regulator RegX3